MIQPYYEHAGITIYHGDCRDVLPTLPRVDLVLTDPPYGIALRWHGGGARSRRPHADYSVTGDDSDALALQVLAGLSHLPTLAFAKPGKPWPGEWQHFLVWDKGGAVGGGGDPARCWKQTWELIQGRNLGALHGARDNAVLTHWVRPQDAQEHPCAKPVGLLRYLLGKVSLPGNVVVDPFMGAGSTLRAAKDTSRRAIGIEIEERYCEIAANRLSQEVLL